MALATPPADRSDRIKPDRWPVTPTPDFADWTPSSPDDTDATDATEPAGDRQPAASLDEADD